MCNMPWRICFGCFLLFCSLDIISGACSDKKFGSGCKLRCRCKNDDQCDDVTGECNSGCDPKWMGPSCQYGNLAFERTAQGNLQNNHVLIDSDKTSCPSGTYNKPYVSIDLQKDFTVNRLILYNKIYESDLVTGLNIHISSKENDFNADSACISKNGSSIGNGMLEVKCSRDLVGRYVIVRISGINIRMPVCEVEIYGGVNGVYGKPTELWEIFDPNKHGKFGSPLAVDGLYDNFAHTRTNHKNPYWKVELEDEIKIYWIRLFYRENNGDRLNNFELKVHNTQMTAFTTIISGSPPYVDIIVNEVGDMVKISRTGNSLTLNLAEFELYYYCRPGSFGFQCEKICNCYESSDVCDYIYGSCATGCALGFNGTDCRTVCPDKTFGRNCVHNCNCQRTDEVCDKANGTCKSGCKSGYKGEDCLQECDAGKFGRGCAKTCNCLDTNEACNRSTGHCNSGCKKGYNGTDCLAVCPDKRFGSNCVHTCNCHDTDEVCAKANGHCDSGCKIGYEGVGCLGACANGKFGWQCNSTCNCEDSTEVCQKSNGNCSKSGCKKGYEGYGCLQECQGKKFGWQCNSTCNCDNSTEICHKHDGACAQSGCKKGYGGNGCLQECEDKTFGSNCPHNCHCQEINEVCNKTNGYCSSGCRSGYEGDGCLMKIVQPPNDTPKIVGGVVGVICALIVIVIVVLVILYRRRKRQKNTQSELSASSKDVLYENADEFENPQNGSSKQSSIRRGRGSSKRLAGNVQDVLIYEPTEDVNEEGPTPALRGEQQYYNTGETSRSTTTVSVDDLWNYVSNKNQNSFHGEFSQLPSTMVKPYEAAKANMWKNRYRGIYAYDHTRVKLSPPNEDGCDYMNANFIEGYNRSKAFIASQGATKHNIGDFWLMIWQQKCTGIVMLTNLVEEAREKCLQYWPKEKGKSEMFGPVQVTVQSEEVFCNFTIRILRASKDGQSRIVTQYHFTAWPDKGVPAYPSSLVQFHHKVRRQYKDNKNPMIVHCSAGVGRTGTFISLDYLVYQAKQEGNVDAFECLKKLREQRVNMIQTLDQYIFLHTALVEALHCKGHYMRCDEFRKLYKDINSDGGLKVLEDNFRKLETIYSGYDVKFTHGKKTENLLKNRNQDILPADSERPMLTPNIAGCGDYINAVFLPGLRKRRQFLVTQTPLENTVIDFWRMIDQHDTKVIVDLGSDPAAFQVFPGSSELTIGPITVISVKKEHNQDIDCIVQTLNVNFRESAFNVIRLIPQFWDERSRIPKSVPKMIKFIYEVEKHGQYGQNGGIVVTCPDGATRCGLFCAAFVSLDRLRVEQEIGTGQIIEQYRSIRPQVIPNKEQLKYCYDILMFHLNENETYSNFA